MISTCHRFNVTSFSSDMDNFIRFISTERHTSGQIVSGLLPDVFLVILQLKT